MGLSVSDGPVSGLRAEKGSQTVGLESVRANRTLRVVIDMTFPNRLQTGTRVYANELVAALRENSSHCFTCLAEPVPKRSRTIGEKIWNGIRNVFWMQVVLPYKLYRMKADVLHATSFFAPLISPCPVIVTVHDTMYLSNPKHYRDRFFLLYARLFIKPAVKRCALINTVSEASRRDIVSVFGVPDTKVQVIYHGVNSRFHPSRQPAEVALLRSKYQLDSPFFLFVGALEPRKNLSRLIQAFDLFLKTVRDDQKFQLVLAGPGGSASEELLEIARQLHISQHIRMLGYVPDEDIPALYSATTAFVFPSLGEGFGLPIVEAMACGTPVVSSNVSCIPEVAGDAALLVDPLETKAIADAMYRVTYDESLRRELVSKGLERAKLFNWSQTAAETERLYELVCSEKRRGFLS